MITSRGQGGGRRRRLYTVLTMWLMVHREACNLSIGECDADDTFEVNVARLINYWIFPDTNPFVSVAVWLLMRVFPLGYRVIIKSGPGGEGIKIN